MYLVLFQKILLKYKIHSPHHEEHSTVSDQNNQRIPPNQGIAQTGASFNQCDKC